MYSSVTFVLLSLSFSFTLFNPFGMGSIHFCVFEDFNMLNYNGSVNEKTFSNNFDASASELLENHEEMFSRYW